jgi:hypothetical protein
MLLSLSEGNATTYPRTTSNAVSSSVPVESSSSGIGAKLGAFLVGAFLRLSDFSADSICST